MYFFKGLCVAVLGFALLGAPLAADDHHNKGVDTVKSAQQALKDAGYYQGSVDGIG